MMSPLGAERLLPSFEKSSGQAGGCLLSWLTSVGPTTAQPGVKPRNMWQPQLVVLGNFGKREKQLLCSGDWVADRNPQAEAAMANSFGN